MDAPGYGYDRTMVPGTHSCCGARHNEDHEHGCPSVIESEYSPVDLAPPLDKHHTLFPTKLTEDT